MKSMIEAVKKAASEGYNASSTSAMFSSSSKSTRPQSLNKIKKATGND